MRRYRDGEVENRSAPPESTAKTVPPALRGPHRRDRGPWRDALLVLDNPPGCASSDELSLRSEGAIPEAQRGGSIFKGLGRIRTTGKRNQNPMPYRLATPPVLRQGIEPKAAAYESAALPLSYLNNIRKELTPLWRSDSLRYSREFLLSKRSPGERPDKRNWPPAFIEPGELASHLRKIFCSENRPFIGLARSLLCSSPQVLRLGSRGLGTNTLTCRDDLRRDR